MPVVELVSEWDVSGVPTFPVVGLIATQQDHGAPAGIENEQRPQVTTGRPELLHVVVTRATDRVRTRPAEARPVLSQFLDGCPDAVRVVGPQTAEPPLCLGCELDLPRPSVRHPSSVASVPVAEQDAFVPTLSKRSAAAMYQGPAAAL